MFVCYFLLLSEPISRAKTLLPYTSVDPDLISFSPNSDAEVYMKSAGTHSDLWFVSINGKLGFVNKKFLREYKVIQKTSQLQVIDVDPTRLRPAVQPNKVQQAHEVFEGTTIITTDTNVNTQEESFTESPAPAVSDNVTPTLKDQVQQPAPVVENVNEFLPNEVDNLVNTINENLPESSTLPQEPVINSEGQSANIEPNPISQPVDQVPQENNVQSISEPPQVPIQHIPAIPTPQILLSSPSGDGLAPAPANTVEVPEQVDNIQPIMKTEEADTTENSSNSANIVDKLPLEPTTETNNVPEITASNNFNNNEGVQINEELNNLNSLPLTSQEIVIDNVNGASSPPPPVLQESQTLPPTGTEETSAAPPQIQETTAKPIEASDYQNNNLYTYPPTELPPAEVPINNIYTYPKIPPIGQENVVLNYPSSTPPPVQETSTENIYSYPPSEQIISEDTSSTEIPINIDLSTESSTEQVNLEPTESPSTDSSEVLTQQLIDEVFSSTTESPATEEENSEGILSNIFSTVSELSDLWTTTTEKPLTEDLFNHEDKSVIEEVDEGFSFIKFVTSFMGPKEESKAIFASGGKSDIFNCYFSFYILICGYSENIFFFICIVPINNLE